MKIPVCPSCGSPDIGFDAHAKWDPALEEMSLSSSYDKADCNHCDRSGFIPEWINVDAAVYANMLKLVKVICEDEGQDDLVEWAQKLLAEHQFAEGNIKS